MQPQFEHFSAELRAQFPDSRVDLQSFPSDAQMLDFFWHGRVWVFAYSPSHGEFGVDELGEDEGFDSGYKHVLQDFESAKQKLLELISIEGGENATVVALG